MKFTNRDINPSSREIVKKKNINNGKFNFHNGQFHFLDKFKKAKGAIEIKNTDMIELAQKNQNTNDVNIYVRKSVIKTKLCLICGDNLIKNDYKINELKCSHYFCADCYYNYIKEKINNNQFLQINCPQKDCEEIIGNNMIVKIIMNDKPLLDKYNKLVKRNQLMLDPKIQLCPFPDCESYAKKGQSKYVKCIGNKHQFCFNCLKQWHDNIPCKDSSITNSLNVLEDSHKVKRCPKCKFFIEKGEGCNHMTCSNCRYQFCWLCMGEYSSNHFNRGMCKGLQNAREMPSKCKLFLNGVVLRFLLIALKSIAFGILAPYVLIIFIFGHLHDKSRVGGDCFLFIYIVCGVLACLTFSAPLLVISNFIVILIS